MKKNPNCTGLSIQPVQRVSYIDAAATYEQRYKLGPHGILEILHFLQSQTIGQNVLEVGCGTGHWLHLLGKFCPKLYGIDFSSSMLAQARKKQGLYSLVLGNACELPFCSNFFDFVYSIHAVQHFSSVEKFIKEAHRVLRTGGVLAVIGMDPHLRRDRWYVYDYFNDTVLRDQLRYPSTEKILRLMEENNFCRCQRSFRAGLDYDFSGKDVFRDPILHKNGTSQLSLLTDGEFSAGISKIKKVIQHAQKRGNESIFPVHIVLPTVYGFVDEVSKK
ncbi:MAG: class I SAM-dependent methyltransferase [Desulfobulbaceae bacterium]|nr:class I SAM-dependent methyltransferase [Desulfobulbaceae bacterium]